MDRLKLHYLQHVGYEGLGYIEIWAKENNFAITATRLYENDPLPAIDAFDWLVIMGGPMSVYESDDHAWMPGEKEFILETIHAGKTVIGICLGAQLIADVLGAKVYPNKHKEIGWFPVTLTRDGAASSIFRTCPRPLEVFQWHGDTFTIPNGALHLAESGPCKNQAFLYEKKVLALQFHLEMTYESAAGLVENCGAELKAGEFIQTREQLFADTTKFTQSNELLTIVLDALLNRSTEVRSPE